MKVRKTIMNRLHFYVLFLYGTFLITNSCNVKENRDSDQFASTTFKQQTPDVIDFNFHVKPILSDRCFKCHGPDANTREADLAFHEKEMAFSALGKNKDRHAIIPGDIENSTLISRITTGNADDIMPPPESNLTLSDYEIEILTKWVEQGAEWKKHWALIPPVQPSIPEVESEGWGKNEIDNFILDKLAENNLNHSELTSKEKLLRRVSFDLTGVPPTIEQLDEFLNDTSADAYEKAVDRLLESEDYAERMALEWMDLARYADTHGYQNDFERLMWPWRDWVIHAFKKNMPYDQFVTWQLAGDLLPNPTLEQIIATGFNRNHKITAEGGVIPEEYRVEYVADRAETFSKAFLGVTMECARCHDHKYDPLSQQEYYSLFGFFNNVKEKGLIDDANPEKALIPEPYVSISQEEAESVVRFINNRDSLEEIRLMVMKEMDKPRPAYILNRGQYDQPLAEVQPETPKAIMPFNDLPKNRLGLSKWLFDPKNPLTARIAVNRFWQQMFGQGIVATSSDFGNQGSLPTHSELLDYLALKFINDKWDIKAMLKYIAMSATYQQTTKVSDAVLEADPENRWLSHAPQLRLNGEMIRDQALFVSGLMNPEVGGPSVKPYQPDGIWEETTGGGGGSTARYIQSTGEQVYRKSLYTFWKRTVPPPSMMTFDAPSRDFCTTKRQKTNTPLQALVLMNDPQIVEASRLLANRAFKEGGDSVEDKIKFMFRMATSRLPDKDELEVLLTYLKEEKSRFENNPDQAIEYLAIGDKKIEFPVGEKEFAAYAILANTVLNLDETISRG